MKFGWAQTSLRCSVPILYLMLSLFLLAPGLYARSSAGLRAGQEQSKKPSRQDRSPWVDGENWDSLSITDSDMHAEPPLTGAKDEGEGFTRELIQVHWRYAGTVNVDVRLISGKIERGIASELETGMPAMTACTQEWLDRVHP